MEPDHPGTTHKRRTQIQSETGFAKNSNQRDCKLESVSCLNEKVLVLKRTKKQHQRETDFGKSLKQTKPWD